MNATTFAIGPGFSPLLTLTNDARVVIVGGPRCGKSYLANVMRERGWRTFCGDPRSTVKEPEHGVTYLPEGLGMGPESSRWIVDNWLSMLGPWVLEGHVMARVLRKWAMEEKDEIEKHRLGLVLRPFPCDRVIVFPNHHPDTDPNPGQRAMHKGVIEKTWREVEDYYAPITTVVDWLD